MRTRQEVLEAAVAGLLSMEQASAELGERVERVQEWVDLLQVGRALGRADAQREAAARGRGARRALTSAALAVTVGAVLWGGFQAWANTCTPNSQAELLAPLVTFCPNAPALAQDVNTNFRTLAQALVDKTGTLEGADLTTNNVAVRPVAKLSFGSQTRQMVNLYGTSYGMGVQASTTYLRTGGGFAFHKGGAHAEAANDPGAGGTTLATLSATGDFTARGVLGGSALRANGCAWVGNGLGIGSDWVMHSLQCPAGQYMAGWRCDASGYLDGNCAAYCCSP